MLMSKKEFMQRYCLNEALCDIPTRSNIVEKAEKIYEQIEKACEAKNQYKEELRRGYHD